MVCYRRTFGDLRFDLRALSARVLPLRSFKRSTSVHPFVNDDELDVKHMITLSPFDLWIYELASSRTCFTHAYSHTNSLIVLVFVHECVLVYDALASCF